LCFGYPFLGGDQPPPGSYLQISAGIFHSCGVRTDHIVVCWTTEQRHGEASPPAVAMTQVSAGLYLSCGIRRDQTLVCWGDNHDGQGSPPSGRFLQVSAHTRLACGLRVDRTLACWGYPGYDRELAVPRGHYVSVGADRAGGCALRTDGAVICWGDLELKEEPRVARGPFAALSVGYQHYCALRPDKTVACFGLDYRLSAATALRFPSAPGCVGPQGLTVQVLPLAGLTWDSAVATVRGRTVASAEGGRVLAGLRLRRLPTAGRFAVTVTVTAHDGRTAVGRRVYRACGA
jgi:Regulator of Chromosome Condensation (RCC1) repeat protein